MKIIELKYNAQLESKFYDCDNLIKFYKVKLSRDEFPNLLNNAKEMTSMFGSTYSCEQLFSSMNFIKSKLKTKVTYGHLNDVLLIAYTTSLSPNINKLAQNKLSQTKQGLNW